MTDAASPSPSYRAPAWTCIGLLIGWTLVLFFWGSVTSRHIVCVAPASTLSLAAAAGYLAIALLWLFLRRQSHRETLVRGQLQESEQKLLQALEVLPLPAVGLDDRGNITLMNRRMADLCACSAGEARGKSWFDTFSPPELRSSRQEAFLELLASGVKELRQEYALLCRNGDRRHLRWSGQVQRHECGRATGVLLLGEDITDTREDELRAQLLNDAADQSPNAVVLVSVSGKVEYANARFVEMTGFELDEVQSWPLHHLISRLLKRDGELDWRSAVMDKGEWSGELGDLRRDGRMYWESVRVKAIRDRAGELRHFLILKQDITERKEAERKLLASEALHRKLLEASPAGILGLLDARITYANPEAARILGHSQAENLCEMDIWSVTGVESAPALTTLLESCARGANCTPVEIVLRRADGRTVSCECRAEPLGQGQGLLLLLRDLSREKRMIEELKYKEERRRLTLSHTQAGFVQVDALGNIEEANPAWLKLYRLPSLEAVRGKPIFEVFSPASASRARQVFDLMIAGHDVFTGELRHPLPDGGEGWHSFTAHVVRQEGRIVAMEGFAIDLTAFHRAQDRYQALFSHMLEGCALHEIICDERGRAVDYRILTVNPSFERMTGITADRALGRTVTEVLPGLDPKWVERYGRVALQGEVLHIEDDANELGQRFEIVAFPTAPKQFAVLVRDMTQQRRIEYELRQAQKLEAVGQLAAGVAHDYNNILVAILMNLALLREEPGLRPEVQESIDELEAEAQRAAAITRQLLLFSRRQAVEIRPFRPATRIENLAKMLRRLIGERIQLQLDCAADLPEVSADPGMFDQVLLNLCLNARDAMPCGGRLLIEAQMVEADAARVQDRRGAAPGPHLCVTVADTGVGMDASVRARIFEPFFTTKAAGAGTGLGLATVQSILQQHRGWVEVESEPDMGSEFRVYFPLNHTPAAATVSEPMTVRDHRAPGVLLVEDDDLARHTTALALRQNGYLVVESSCSAEACSTWAKRSAELSILVSDVVMPGGMNGVDLAKRLRAEKPGLGVVLISGYPGESGGDLSSIPGARFLPKPFDFSSLASAIARSRS